MPSLSTSITGVAFPSVVAAVVGVFVVVVAVVVVVVSLLLVLGRIGPAVFCRVTLLIATGTMHLPAFTIVMKIALVALWEISKVLLRGTWSG